jgi:hypothetical protein
MNTLGLVIDAHTTTMVRRAAQRQRVTLDVWITIALRSSAAEVLGAKRRKPGPKRVSAAKVVGIPLDENPC